MAKSSLLPESDDSELEEDEDDSENSQSVCVVPTKQSVSTPVSILIESLVKNIVEIYEPNGEKAITLYKDICHKLYKMKMIDESYNMPEFEGIRSQFERAFIQLITSKVTKNIVLKPNHVHLITSHYLREFDELDFISKGGFGHVFLVRHKLDGTEYAVKKIPIRSEGIKSVKTYLSEVKTFASLNHSNIVQYKAAWLEINENMESNKPIIKHIDDDYMFTKQQYSFSDKHMSSSDDFEVRFEHSIDNLSSFKIDRKRLRRDSKSKSASDINALCKVEDLLRIRPQKIDKWATLYIQMALCQSTLKQWLDKRNEIASKEAQKPTVVSLSQEKVRHKSNREILTQILRGIEYIHSKGIVHHDIKPSNIFIQPEGGSILVQLGDFGLACPLQSARHSLAFGTKMYAAPEQLAGECNSKSDLYSLGIVLYELVENLNTDMERVRHIEELRKGIISDKLFKREPQFAQLIRDLTVKDCTLRPDARTILKQLQQSDENGQISELRQTLLEKEDEIEHLKELLRSHGIKTN